MNAERRDILSRILERLREMQPSISEEMAVQLELQIRHEYAGEEVYIQKKTSETRRRRIKRMFDGRNVEEVAVEVGVSRRSVYRAIKSR